MRDSATGAQASRLHERDSANKAIAIDVCYGDLAIWDTGRAGVGLIYSAVFLARG
ncbi:MAG: hypothetical protein R2684_08430 [Pyrinomonadaceae bacterium]